MNSLSEGGTAAGSDPDELYRRAAIDFGDAIDRLVRAYERETDRQPDLRQEIHLALWRSFGGFESRCSLRTWVYRVAHNVASAYVVREKRIKREMLTNLEDLDRMAESRIPDSLDSGLALDRLFELIHRLRPPDRQLMLLYLEDLDAASIGEITGLSVANVRTRIHRIRGVLAKRYHSESGRTHE
jgi:RNA polymerase sigma-70 factor (ECF subfamily)